MIARLWNYYSINLAKRPLMTKSITSGVISITADITCQMCFPAPSSTIPTLTSSSGIEVKEEKVASELDLQRLSKFSFLGFALVGPTLHYWYGFLGNMSFPFKSQVAKTSMRLLLDQGFFTPIFVAVFMSSVIVLEQLDKSIMPTPGVEKDTIETKTNTSSGPTAVIPSIENSSSTFSLIKDRLSADYVSTLKMNYTLWIPAMFANFYFIPLLYQTLFSNSVGLVWNIYLSWSSYKAPISDVKDSCTDTPTPKE